MDLPRRYTIRESGHRIHNPFSSDKLATLGRALSPPPGTRMLDLASGAGEMLCTWARDHRVTGTGIDISTVFIAAARARADELGVGGRVSFVHGDAAGYVADAPVGIASCVGATWIGGGVPGTVELLRRSLRPGGLLLIGEPYWRRNLPTRPPPRAATPSAATISCPCRNCSNGSATWAATWSRWSSPARTTGTWYAAAQWPNIRRWLDANPDDELAGELRAELAAAPARYARYRREYLGWGVFALMNR